MPRYKIISLKDKATASEIDTGTDDAKYATAKALKDSAYLSSMSDVVAASDTVAGKIEVATAAEINTGTDAGRSLSPDTFADSNFGKRLVSVKVFDDVTALTTGDGKFICVVPFELSGMNLVQAEAAITTVSSSGLPSIALRNVTDTTNPLTTDITIDATEFTSYTAATRSVVNASYDDFVTGDRIAIDVDAAGTGSMGLIVFLTFQLP